LTEDELTASAVAAAGRLRRFALHLSRDSSLAEDLVQEGLVRALAARGRLRDPSLLLPWMFSIIRHTFLTQARRATRRAQLLETSATAVTAEAGDLEKEILARGFSDDVLRALDTLPEEWRTTVLLCDVEELSYEEIAEAMDCPLGTVRSRLARARSQLLSALRGRAREPGPEARR
jgi:RNA polymerase sigma-70 factor (ECF subfamily)